MITTILLLIILSISLFIITIRVYSISILLGAITIFIIGSFILFEHNHILIGSIFLIVYSGAILVFICISLLISPAIRSQQNSYENNNQILNIKGIRVFFFFFIILFFIVFFSNYLINYTSESNLIEFNYNKLLYNIPIVDWNPILDWTPNYIFPTKDKKNNLTCNINTAELSEFLIRNFENSKFINISNPVFDIPSFNLNNLISLNFKDDFILIISIGIYLLLTLLCCLVLFSINHEKRLIKRQDSIDQILKRWI